MSLSEYEDFVFGAGLLNQPDPVAAWKKSASDSNASSITSMAKKIIASSPPTAPMCG